MSAALAGTPAGRAAENYLNTGYSVRSWLLTTDHKRVALLYLASITLFFAVGMALAGLLRLELITPPGDVFEAETYSRLFTMHGLVMICLFLIPAIPAVLGNFLIPLMIGARGLAFPRLNLAGWYLFLLGGGIILWTMISGGVDTGWTFYIPYSSSYSSTSVTVAVLGVVIVLASSVLTALNFIVTVHRRRAPGLTWFGLPLFVWAQYAASLVMVAASPALLVLVVLAWTNVSDPVVFQQVLWFYAHPVVYVTVLPAMGVVSEMIACFAHRGVFGYRFMVYATIGIATFSFLVWGHHMLVSIQSIDAGMVFSLLSLLAAVPAAIMVFHWVATLYRGSVSYSAPMLYAMGFLGLFSIGGASGLFLATPATNIHLHGTHFEVAHLHCFIAGGVLMAYLGGLHYWWPKMTGRLNAEGWGKLSALFIFAGWNLAFFPEFLLGYLGMPSRMHGYPEEFQLWNVVSSVGAALLVPGVLAPLIYLAWSMRYGPRAQANPWVGTGREWRTSSPPPRENFTQA